MRPFLTTLVLVGVLAAVPSVASAAQEDNASCMGLGASFYGQFAPQQMAFVAAFVNGTALTAGVPPGTTYSLFAREKEGGGLPSPCGTGLE